MSLYEEPNRACRIIPMFQGITRFSHVFQFIHTTDSQAEATPFPTCRYNLPTAMVEHDAPSSSESGGGDTLVALPPPDDFDVSSIQPCVSCKVQFSLDEWVEMAARCEYLPEADIHQLCDLVASYLIDEPNIVPVSTPITLCGDIHGQYYDLEELFKVAGKPPDRSFVFMGDFVDRGRYSLETWIRLMSLKAKYPAHIVLIRGNHETRQITQVYGFYDECLNKYGNVNVWRHCCRVFDLLPIGALVDDKVLCVHGGLSPEVKTLNTICTIPRDTEIPHKGAFCDLVWSDPEEVDSWAISPRGAGWLFGKSVTDRFLHTNNITMIARAHQLVQEGYRYIWDDSVVTVWSAPNYCYRCGNVAAVLQLDTVADRKPIIFEAVPDEKRVIPPMKTTPYFL